LSCAARPRKRGRQVGARPRSTAEQRLRDALFQAVYAALPGLKPLDCARLAVDLTDPSPDWWEVNTEQGLCLVVESHLHVQDEGPRQRGRLRGKQVEPTRDGKLLRMAKKTLSRATGTAPYSGFKFRDDERHALIRDASLAIVILRTRYVLVADQCSGELLRSGWPYHVVRNLVGYSSWLHDGHLLAHDRGMEDDARACFADVLRWRSGEVDLA